MTDTSHDAVREALLDHEPSDLSDAMKAHFDGCEECRELHAALFAIDAGLGELPVIEAPLDLVARTLAAVDALPREAPVKAAAPAGMMALFGALLAGLFSGIWALLGLLVAPFKKRQPWMIAIPALGALGLVFVVGLGTLTLSMRMSDEGPVAAAGTTEPTDDGWADLPSADPARELLAPAEDAPPPVMDPAFGAGNFEARLEEAGEGDDENGRYWHMDPPRDVGGEDVSNTIVAARDGYRPEPEADRGVRPANGLDGERGDTPAATTPPAQIMVDGRLAEEGRRLDVAVPQGRHTVQLQLDSTTEANAENERGEPVGGTFRQRAEVDSVLAQQLDRLGYVDDHEEADERTGQLARGPSSGDIVVVPNIAPSEEDVLAPDGTPSGAHAYAWAAGQRAQGSETATLIPRGHDGDLDEAESAVDRGRARHRLTTARDAHQGLTFRSPTGYWANTYVPGDPAVRSLRRRLADHPAAVQLAELAQPGAPGLSPPRSGALSLSVSADRAQIEGRSRVLVSVGLRGAAQRAGRRPSLRAQVVLDLRSRLDDDAEGRVRALLSSLSRRRDGADQIGVLVAGPDGGAHIELGTMRFGEVSVALRRAFGPTPDGASAVSLRESLETAITSIGQLDEDAPLGSSMVLLVTPGLTEADSQELARAAHMGALAGVTTTVIGLDDAVALAPIERVALAGQGRRRILESAGGADALVREEITAVSRVVARAVRLRIRLAEGVQLVDVLGSRSLDEAQAQRVREAEQAIDQALAQRLGITSDRGDDEDGIQIVVPAFYADDSHRVLLDLVVPGPGPVADVQARFKDLLRLGNGTLTERIVISRGTAARGPAERAVYAQWLGHQLSNALRRAASQLDAGQPDAARTTLDEARQRVTAAWDVIPELASEPALTRDVSLCERYRDALTGSAGGAAQPADVMASSLRFAAHRRLLGDPLGLGGEP